MPSKNIANMSAQKLEEANKQWQKIASGEHNPFSGFNLKGSNSKLSAENFMEEINYIVKNELSSCLSNFAYGSNRNSQWIF